MGASRCVVLVPFAGAIEPRCEAALAYLQGHGYEVPECNQHFGRPIVPYYLPLVIPHRDGQWYLSEDYAFCERARQCGFAVQADTTIRLGHVGSHGCGWEDVGRPRQRIDSYACNFNWQTGDAGG